MLSQQDTYTTEADYLQWEARQPARHEYIGGQIHAMTGATLRHNVIVVNIIAALRPHLRATPCRAFVEAVKLRVARNSAIYYPDVLVSCDKRLQDISAGQHLVEEATVVIEVLSESTEGIDRREKLNTYRTLAELKEYVLVSQNDIKIEIYRRQGDIGWELITLEPGDPFELKSLNFSMPIEEVYAETGCGPVRDPAG